MPWDTLEISDSKNITQRDVKKAYIKKLKSIDLEHDPNGLQKLREAYKDALFILHHRENEDEKSNEGENDPIVKFSPKASTAPKKSNQRLNKRKNRTNRAHTQSVRNAAITEYSEAQGSTLSLSSAESQFSIQPRQNSSAQSHTKLNSIQQCKKPKQLLQIEPTQRVLPLKPTIRVKPIKRAKAPRKWKVIADRILGCVVLYAIIHYYLHTVTMSDNDTSYYPKFRNATPSEHRHKESTRLHQYYLQYLDSIQKTSQ